MSLVLYILPTTLEAEGKIGKALPGWQIQRLCGGPLTLTTCLVALPNRVKRTINCCIVCDSLNPSRQNFYGNLFETLCHFSALILQSWLERKQNCHHWLTIKQPSYTQFSLQISTVTAVTLFRLLASMRAKTVWMLLRVIENFPDGNMYGLYRKKPRKQSRFTLCFCYWPSYKSLDWFE